jgi:hypothetical protein
MGPHLEGDPLRHNDKWLEERRNDAARLVRASNRVRNAVRFGSNETYNHFRTKVEVCYQLVQDGKDYITEAIFEGGGRADIINLDDHIIIECLETETELEACSKCTSYPGMFAIEFARFADGKIIRGLLRS